MPKLVDCLKIRLDTPTQFLKVIDTYDNSGDHVKRLVLDGAEIRRVPLAGPPTSIPLLKDI